MAAGPEDRTASADLRFEQVHARLPAPLREAAAARWQAFAPAVADLAADGTRPWLARLAHAFACSEFVAQAAERDPEIVRELLASGDLERAYEADVLARRVHAAAHAADDEAALKRALRLLRRRELVRVAWRDLAGAAPLAEVVATLSELADACIDAALAWLSARMRADVGTPRGPDGQAVDLSVLALGKLGGGELNFSSDVDLIFAYAEDGEVDGPRALSNSQYFLRLAQALIRVLAEPTADGFVFRVDTRLRPFGASGPLALSFDAMEHYYQTHGRDWERYAMIKARACAGDVAAGNRLLAQLKPFVYRRYLDYGALESIREMKQLIAREVERKSMAANLKLGPGGIREIEFIVQALQLIRAGREPQLQGRETLPALARLARAGHVETGVAETLEAAYVFLRNSEHALQMAADQQVHDLPGDTPGRARLAAALGFEGWEAYRAALDRHRQAVQATFADLLGPPEQAATATDGYDAVWGGGLDDEQAHGYLQQAGYRDPAAVMSLLAGFRESSVYQALSAEGRERLDRLVPLLLHEAARMRDPDTAIARLIQLCEAIGRRTAYFALLIENPTALAQLVSLAAASPWVAGWISRHPVLLDELLDPRALYELPDRQALEAEVAARLGVIGRDDLEAQMNALRELRNSHLLRVAAAELGPGLEPDEVGLHLSRLADVLLAVSLDLSYRLLVERHGHPAGDAQHPEPGFAVIGYGKLGSLELGYASDLDMIFLYDEVDGGHTGGARPVPNELFFARLGQRLIHVLTARTPAGILYEVDMRLRPSGNSGPLVASLAAFTRYQQTQAWTWEHQALVRARAVAGSPGLRAAFEQARLAILCRPRDEAALQREVRAMRARMAAANAGGEGFDVKHDPGGIVDIEFMVQYWVLRWAYAHPDIARSTDNIHLMEALAGRQLIPADWAELLIRAYRRCLALEQRLKLMERGARVAVAELGDLPQAVRSIWNQVFSAE